MVTWDRTAARAQNRHSVPTARCTGRGGIGKTLESSILKVPALHREAERDTTGSFSYQPVVHTWIGALVQGNVEGGVATLQHSTLFAMAALSAG